MTQLNPAQRWQHVLAQLDTAKYSETVTTQLDLEGFDQSVLSEVRDEFLDDAERAEIKEFVNEVGNTRTEAELEQIGRSEHHVDPFLEVFLRRAAHFTQEQFPKYSAAAVDGINRITAAALLLLFTNALPTILYATYGIPPA